MADTQFWDDQVHAQHTIQALKALKARHTPIVMSFGLVVHHHALDLQHAAWSWPWLGLNQEQQQ